MSQTSPDQQPKPEMPAPKGGLSPYLQLEGATKAAAFYERAFGAEHAFAYPPDEQGRTMHVHLYVNGSSLMLSDAYPEYGHSHQPAAGYTLTLHLRDEEIDAWWARAVEAGCDVVSPLQVMFWGDRYGQVRDPFGVMWAMNARTA